MKKLMKNVINLILIFSVFLSVTACGSEKNEWEEVELIDPISTIGSFYSAEYRDIYNAKVYSGLVVPEIKEYSFDVSQTFDGYTALVGDGVQPGDVLIKGSVESFEKQIEALEEAISDAKEEYDEYILETNDSLASKKSELESYGQIVNNFENMTEEEANGYNNYASEFNKYKALYANTDLAIQRLDEALKEKTEIYNLDNSYNNSELKKLKKQKNNATVTSDMKGTVVSQVFYDADHSYIGKDTPVIAVGDLGEFRIKTEFISKSTINKAIEYYAIVDGERYELEYVEMETEEYNRLLKENDAVYSTFLFKGDTSKINQGDFVTVVLVNDYLQNALCVPKDSVNKDDSGYFVYVLEDDGSKTRTGIKKGISDSLYTEVLSGLEEGAKVISDTKVKERTNTAVIELGNINSDFKESGYFWYPVTEWIKNPVEYGTAYLDEILVSKYETVEKGQVIANIRVEADSIEIKRQERNLLRANEALNSLIENNDSNGSNNKAIKAQNERISELKELISDMKSDGKIKEIKAPFNGVVTDIIKYETGDILNKDGKIIELSESDSNYILVEDDNCSLTFGNDVSISYMGADRTQKTAEGTVVTVSKTAVSKAMTSNYSIVSIPKEYLSDIAGSSRNDEGWWSRTKYTVTAELRNMENVLLVPKAAVTESGGYTFVTIKDENGNFKYKSFIAGGSNKNYYWVADGLTEGMEICLD